MGFILKLVFIYFLFKFLWSVSRERIIKKLIKFINKKLNSQMNHQQTSRRQGPSNNGDGKKKKGGQKKDTFDADYKVIK